MVVLIMIYSISLLDDMFDLAYRLVKISTKEKQYVAKRQTGILAHDINALRTHACITMAAAAHIRFTITPQMHARYI